MTRRQRILLIALVATVVLAAIWWVPKWQVGKASTQGMKAEELPKLENEYRRTLAQIVGGLVVIGGLYLTWRRIRATEEGQITERFTRAIEHLGDQRLEVRLGGIYALERIARDSAKDHWTCMEVLCAFVRDRPAPEETTPDASIPTDAQAVLTVISRRSREREVEGEQIALAGAHLEKADLRGARLQGADLRGIHLEEAIITDAHLEQACLAGAHLDRADLTDAHLQGADLTHAHLEEALLVYGQLEQANLESAHLEGAILGSAHLERAWLYCAQLDRADLTAAHLEGANLRGAVLEGANLTDAHLEGADLTSSRRHLEEDGPTGEPARLEDLERLDQLWFRRLTQEQIEAAVGDAETKLPEWLKRPDHWQ